MRSREQDLTMKSSKANIQIASTSAFSTNTKDYIGSAILILYKHTTIWQKG